MTIVGPATDTGPTGTGPAGTEPANGPPVGRPSASPAATPGPAGERVAHPGRRLTALVVVVVVLSLVALGLSIGQLRATVHQRHRVDAATAASTAASDSLQRQRAALASAVAEVDASTRAVRARSHLIDDAVVELRRLRSSLTTVRAGIRRATAASASRQSTLDLLGSCQASVHQAAAILEAAEDATPGVGSPGANALAAATLDRARSACQSALAVVDGATQAVHPYDFPDPSVMQVGGTFYAYATNGPAGTVQALSSTDLETWKVLPPALATVPAWAEPGYTWGPAIQPVGQGYVLYYAVRARGTGKQCISSAVAPSPTGPFVDQSARPMVCQPALGGSIDPSTYRDGYGFLHLTWKSEGETVGGRATIWSQYLSGDGRSVVGDPAALLSADERWEDRVIENPSLVELGGTWVLLFSGNHWSSSSYATAYATCAGPLGPCATPADDVVLETGGTIVGPGGAQFFPTAGGRMFLAYAAWDAGSVGYPNARRLHIALATFTDGRLVLTAP